MAVRRAVGNLIDNALRYAGEPVEVELRNHAQEVSIEVRDRGPGIPSGEVERLKRPFTRLDAARGGRPAPASAWRSSSASRAPTAAGSTSCRAKAAAWWRVWSWLQSKPLQWLVRSAARGDR